MKIAQSTEEITRKGRTSDKPNPFLETATLEQFKSGNTFRIDLEPNDKPHSIVTQLRAAAKTVGMSVTYRTDEGKKLTEVSSFLVKFITPRKRGEGEAETPAVEEAPKATTSKRK